MKYNKNTNYATDILLIVSLSFLLIFSAFFFLNQSISNNNLTNRYESLNNTNIKLISEIYNQNNQIAKKNTPASLLLNSNPTIAGFLTKDGDVKLASSSKVTK